MRIAIAQTNPIVGDVRGNTTKIVSFITRANDAGADLVVFPELSILGYPPRDLLLKRHMVEANVKALEEIARAADGITAVLGYACPNETDEGKSLWNAAAICSDGKVSATYGKRLLPTYDVFDERRYFEPSNKPAVADIKGNGRTWKVGLTICEDLWNVEQKDGRRLYADDPVSVLKDAGAELIVNLSASPFYVDKQPQRVELFSRQIARAGIPLVYVNQVGGNDDLVFDGASAAFASDGSLIAQAKAFEEDLLIVDPEKPAPGLIQPYPESIASVHDALVMGTRDYLNKCGFKAVVIGLSGGIDSAVTAAIAAEALGSDAVHGIAMPSRYSSDHSLSDAEGLARNLGIDYRVIAIEAVHAAMETEMTPHFEGLPENETEENIQARIRGGIVMALSNKFNWLLLTTGNKSELAVGYCTLYGDMCGGLAVVSDVPKIMVYDVARYINQRAGREIIPENTITKPPSAELKNDQCDQDSLPPYEELDEILRLYVEEEWSTAEIVEKGFAADVVNDVINKVDRNEYKRKQAAVGLKVTSRAFGTGRRMPIAARFR